MTASSSRPFRRSLKLVAPKQVALSSWSVDANCNVDNADAHEGLAGQIPVQSTGILLLLSQRGGMLSWQSPEKVDFIFTNQSTARASTAQKVHSRSDHKPLCLTRSRVSDIMLEFRKKKEVHGGLGSHKRCHNTTTFQKSISQRTVLGSTVGHIQQAPENFLSEVDKERQSQTCEPVIGVEKQFDAARRDLQNLVSSASLQTFFTSSLGQVEPPGIDGLRGTSEIETDVVAELRAKVAAVKRLASLRRLTSKVISKRQPSSLRDAEGQQVEDQNRWCDTVHEHSKEKIKYDDAVNSETTRRI